MNNCNDLIKADFIDLNLDVSINEEVIIARPDIPIGAIHMHSNKEVLEELGDSNGKLIYKGSEVGVSDLIAENTSVDTSNFNNNLSVADDTVQKALDTLDELEIGGGGGSPFSDTELLLYAELKQKITDSTLEIGKYYEVTDFQTKNVAGFGQNYTAPVENLIFSANKTNEVLKQVYSRDFPNDIILFDIDDTGIIGNISGGWEDGEDWEEEITTDNWTTSTFDINKNPVIDDNFYIYAESDSGEVEYEADGLDNDFTITDLGNGWYRITDLTGDADFSNPDYNYAEIEFNTVILERNGNIIYRRNPEKRIETTFDFRGVKYNRARLNLASIQNYSSSTNYNKGDLVKNGNSVYRATENNSNKSLSATYWIKLFNYANEDWCFSSPSAYLNGLLPVDSSVVKLVPVFAVFDGNNFEYNDDTVFNVTILEKGNVMTRRNSYDTKFENIYILNNSTDNTFAGDLINIKLTEHSSQNMFVIGSYVENVLVRSKLYNNIISGFCKSLNIGDMQGTIIEQLIESNIEGLTNSGIKSVQNTQIGSSCTTLNIKTNNNNIGNNNNNFFLLNSSYNIFGNSNSNIKSTNNAFSNNKFGDLNKYFNISGAFTKSTFGNNNGKYSYWVNFTGSVIGFIIGNDNFYRGLSSFSETIQNVIMGNSNSKWNIGYFVNSIIGNNVREINVYRMQSVELKDSVSYLTFPQSTIYGCIFEPALQFHTYNGSGYFKNNHIKTSSINYGNNPTHVKNDYFCEVFQRPDGVNKVSFIGNSDTLEVVDPTT